MVMWRYLSLDFVHSTSANWEGCRLKKGQVRYETYGCRWGGYETAGSEMFDVLAAVVSTTNVITYTVPEPNVVLNVSVLCIDVRKMEGASQRPVIML